MHGYLFFTIMQEIQKLANDSKNTFFFNDHQTDKHGLKISKNALIRKNTLSNAHKQHQTTFSFMKSGTFSS